MWTSVEPSSSNRILLQPLQQSICQNNIQSVFPQEQTEPIYSHKSLSQSFWKCSWRSCLVFLVFFDFFPALSLAVMRWCTGSLSRILSLSEKLICSLGGADGNRTHVLKVTELLTLRKELFDSNLFIKLGKKEPCCCPCTSTSRTLGLRTSHESSSPFLSVRFTATACT
jgi:hypothetical protein